MDGKNGRAKRISRAEAGEILTEMHLLNESGGTFYHRGVWYEYPADPFDLSKFSADVIAKALQGYPTFDDNFRDDETEEMHWEHRGRDKD